MAERRDYVENAVNRQLEPTLPDSLDTDSTGASAASAQRVVRNPTQPTRRQSPATEWLTAHYAEILVYVVFGVVIVGMCVALYNLNGQVGQLRGQLEAKPSQQDLINLQRAVRDDVDRSREELQREIDRMLDQIRVLFPAPPPSMAAPTASTKARP